METLPQKFFVFSDVVLANNGNIDNVVVGPTGIWTIEVKSHSGEITFDGNELVRDGKLLEKDFIGQAWAEAYSLRNFLQKKMDREFIVQPVILFSNPEAELHFGFNKVSGVYVIKIDWLKRLIVHNKLESFDNEIVEKLVHALENSSE